MTVFRARGDSEGRGRLVAVVSLVLASLSAVSTPAQVASSERQEDSVDRCAECHRAPNLFVLDPRTGRRLDLTVESDVYAQSVHGRLRCAECHPYGYDRLPHSAPLSRPPFECVDCHEKRGDLKVLELGARKEEFRASVHQAGDAALEGCHSCHDTHAFRLVRGEGEALHRIEISNRLCLTCHGPIEERPSGFGDLQDATASHGLFPGPRAHFRKIKCVTCHTVEGVSNDHDVEPARLAARDCGRCHQADEGTRLFADSYSDRRAGRDIVDGHVVEGATGEENVYVIGSTRSVLLDRLGLGALGLTALVIGLHVLARILGRRV